MKHILERRNWLALREQTEPDQSAQTSITQTDASTVAAVNSTEGETSAQQELDQKLKNVLDAAKGQLGKKYKWGGSKPETGFDCSGLVSYVTGLARTTADGYFKSKSLTKIKKEEVRPGDLIFFGSAGRAHHIGIVDTVDATGKVTSMIHARGRESCPGNVATNNCKVEQTVHMDWYNDILGYGRI